MGRSQALKDAHAPVETKLNAACMYLTALFRSEQRQGSYVHPGRAARRQLIAASGACGVLRGTHPMHAIGSGWCIRVFGMMMQE